MGVKTIIQAAVAAPRAWQTYRRWRSQSGEDNGEIGHYHGSHYDPEWSSPRSPLLMDQTSTSEGGFHQQGIHPATYGAIGDADDLPGYGGSAVCSSPERMRRDSATLLREVPEAEEDDDDDAEQARIEEELEEGGFYTGSYARFLFLYTLVPITAVLVWVTLAVLPSIAYSTKHPSSLYPYLPYIPFPLPEILTSSALWCLAYLTRPPIFAFLSLVFSNSTFTWLPTVISTFLSSFIAIALCIASLAILQVPLATLSAHPTCHDPAFLRVWFLALGWALAEALVAVSQGYNALASFKHVLVTIKDRDDREASALVRPELETSGNADSNGKAALRDSAHTSRSGDVDTPHQTAVPSLEPFPDQRLESETLMANDLELQRRTSHLSEAEVLQMELDQDFDEMMAVKARDELEQLYGIPYIKIPVFLTCLQRLNSVLLALGVYLLTSAAYFQSPLSTPTVNFASSITPLASAHTDHSTHFSSTPDWETTKSNQSLYITLPTILCIHAALAALHTQLVLPKIGVHTVVYAGCLVSLGSFFAGLGVWEALS